MLDVLRLTDYIFQSLILINYTSYKTAKENCYEEKFKILRYFQTGKFLNSRKSTPKKRLRFFDWFAPEKQANTPQKNDSNFSIEDIRFFCGGGGLLHLYFIMPLYCRLTPKRVRQKKENGKTPQEQ